MCSIKKQESDQDAGGSNEAFNGVEQNQPGKSPKKQRRPVKRFGEMSEEDVLKLKLPEHLDYNLDILFVSMLNLIMFNVKLVSTKEHTDTSNPLPPPPPPPPHQGGTLYIFEWGCAHLILQPYTSLDTENPCHISDLLFLELYHY